MKYRIQAFWLFVLSPLFLFSQGEFSYDFELQYVNFTSGSTMQLDNNSGTFTYVNEYELVGAGAYTTYPVAYVAGNTFSVEADFLTSCLNTDLYVRGIHVRPDGTILTFPAQALNSGNAGELHYDFAQPTDNGSTFTFPASTVEFHDPFEITWQVCWEDSPNDADWMDIHTSGNPVYVSRDNPIFPQTGSFFDQVPFHTYFRASCEAANNLSTDDEIIAAVWTIFATLGNFSRADDGVPFEYYNDWTNAEFFANDMIPSNAVNGQCSAFSISFLNCLSVHGINQTDDYLRVEPILPPSSESFGLLVKNFESITTSPFAHWTNNTPPTIPTGFTIDNVLIPLQNGNSYNFISSVFEDNFLYTEIADVSGVAGQGNGNPKAAFANHQIIRLTVGGSYVYYDVPYGLTYSSLDQMKDNLFGYIYRMTASVDEISLGMNLNSNPALETNAAVTVWLIDKDQNALELNGVELDNF